MDYFTVKYLQINSTDDKLTAGEQEDLMKESFLTMTSVQAITERCVERRVIGELTAEAVLESLREESSSKKAARMSVSISFFEKGKINTFLQHNLSSPKCSDNLMSYFKVILIL